MLEFFVVALGFAVLAAVRAHREIEYGDPLPYNVLCVVLIIAAAILSARM